MHRKMIKKLAAITLSIASLALLCSCQLFDKPWEGSGHSKDGTVYNITIQTDDVYSIGVSSENSSTGTEPAAGDAFAEGEVIGFSELDYENGEEIIWSVKDADGNIVETIDHYINDGKTHAMVIGEDHQVLPQ